MARINIEDSLFEDRHFQSFIVLMKSEIKAIGWWYKAAKVAQVYWKNNKELIPEEVFRFHKFPRALLDSGLLRKRENGYYFHGSEKNFAWIFSKVENGKKGGRPLKASDIIEKQETYDITYGKATNNPLTPSLTPSLTPTTKVVVEGAAAAVGDVFHVPSLIKQNLMALEGYPENIIHEVAKEAWLLYDASSDNNKNWARFLAHYFKNEKQKIRERILNDPEAANERMRKKYEGSEYEY